MSNKEKGRNKLSREILGLFGAIAAISVFFYGFLNVMANSIVLAYCERNNIIFNEMIEWTVENWIQSISVIAAVVCFVILFLFLMGQKLSYLNQIIKGVDALREHRLNYEMPLEGDNELTELAERMNYLAKTERELQEKEEAVRKEKENMIRALSHDIRTPLTAILSYSEYIGEKEELDTEIMKGYVELVQQKAIQIKGLTNILLEGEQRNLEFFENGKFLMLQLAEEWEAALEEAFTCVISFDNCKEFSGKFDVQELRRIFDNLISNIRKYANPEKDVLLSIECMEDLLIIKQKNSRKKDEGNAESYKIGMESIKNIAGKYSGELHTSVTEEEFEIRIELKCEV